MERPTLIILTDPVFQLQLITEVRTKCDESDLTVRALETLSSLSAALDQAKGQTRLIAFCTGTIVPAATLKRFDSGAYNFHPGPPEYPGIFPSCFAIYEDAKTFGATAHQMTDRVDEGEIIGTQSFPLSRTMNRLSLDKLALDNVLLLFRHLLPRLIDLANEIPSSGDSWRGQARTKKDFNALCELPSDSSQDEFDRRYRAVGEGPDHALSIRLFGQRFRLNNDHAGDTVVRGGLSTD